MSLGKGNRHRWWQVWAVAVGTASLLGAVAGTAGASARPAATGLAAVRTALAQRLVPGSAVGIDPATHQVVLTLTASAARTAGLIAAARGYGPTVRIIHAPGRFSFASGHIFGGNGIIDNNDGVICTLGFNTTGGFALTAGHCAAFSGPWFKEGTTLLFGPAIDSEFNNAAHTDFGQLRDDGGIAQRAAIQGYDAGIIGVTGAGNAFVGESACKSGRTTGRTCGSVTAVDVTVIVNDNGVLVEVDHMIQTNICVMPGDSGGPLYDGGTALGLTSASNLTCSGATSFFQPVIPALNFYGVSLLTS